MVFENRFDRAAPRAHTKPKGMGTTLTDIKFDCAHCGQRMVVDCSAAGLATECPYCNASIVIPRRASLHDAAPMSLCSDTANGGRHREDTDLADHDSAELRQELTDASVEISRLEAEVAQVEKLKKDKRKLRDDLVRLKKELAGKEEALAAREKAEGRAIALADELNRIEAELTQEQEQTGQLRAEIDALTTERVELIPRLEEAEREVASLRDAMRVSEVENQELRTTLADTQAERTTALREIQSLENRLADLGAELANTRAVSSETAAKLRAATEELAATRKRLADSEESARSLAICVEELKRERDALSKSLSENTAGADLVVAREQLGVATKERDRLGMEVERLNTEIDSARERQRKLEEEMKVALRELDEARRRAEAASEHRLRQDNEVLRGIIARQNSELEQRHLQIVRLKRARLGVRMAYAAFGIALLLIAMWAMKVVPGLKLGKMF